MREAPRNFSSRYFTQPPFEQRERAEYQDLTGARGRIFYAVIKMQRGKNEVEIRRLIKAVLNVK